MDTPSPAGTAEGNIILWDFGTKGVAKVYRGGHAAAVTSVCWSRDGRRLASGSQDSKVILWDVMTGEQVRGGGGQGRREGMGRGGEVGVTGEGGGREEVRGEVAGRGGRGGGEEVRRVWARVRGERAIFRGQDRVWGR